MAQEKMTAPRGMSGLYCEPWNSGDIYAVAADWGNASSPIRVYGEDGWTLDHHGRQVADFCHSPHAALVSILAENLRMTGTEDEDEAEDEAESLAEDAEELLDADDAEELLDAD